MRDTILHAPLLICVLVLVVACVSSLLPISPVEALLVALSTVVPTSLLLPVAGLATVGHMAAKTLVYLGSRRAEPAVPVRHRAALQRVRTLLLRRRRVRLLTMLVSALAGVPPFYLVTVCCGVLRLPLWDFLVAGTVGRGIRFGALALMPRGSQILAQLGGP
jgi:membrane protein YqaA with SNARE-associated domain